MILVLTIRIKTLQIFQTIYTKVFARDNIQYLFFYPHSLVWRKKVAALAINSISFFAAYRYRYFPAVRDVM